MKPYLLSRGGPWGSPGVLLRASLIASAATLTTIAVGPASFAQPAPQVQPEPAVLVTPDDMHTGALLLKTTEGGKFLEAPRLKTDVSITVTGPTARAVITQRFENPSDKWVEGIYVYPLPQNAAVDTLKMQVGDKFLEGKVKERVEARQIYEKAAAEGYKATLIEQQRPKRLMQPVGRPMPIIDEVRTGDAAIPRNVGELVRPVHQQLLRHVQQTSTDTHPQTLKALSRMCVGIKHQLRIS